MKTKEYLNRIKRGCNEWIYVKGYDGEEPYNTGWRCGSSAGGGINLYCIPCGNKIKKLESKLEREVK